MRRTILAAFAAAVTSVTAFGAVTLLALEGQGVAVLHTTRPDGQVRRTRVWFVETEGAWWVEAATTSRPFYRDLVANPQVALELPTPPAQGQPPPPRSGSAELVPEPGGHRLVRELLARKYGWADAWVAMLQDTSASRAVRIVPR